MSFSIYDTLMELSTDDYHVDNASPVPVSTHFASPLQTNSNNVHLLDLDAPNSQEYTPISNMQTSMMPFLETREICLDAIHVKKSDLKLMDNANILRKDQNFLNMVIRSAVHTTGARSIKGFELHRIIAKIKNHVPNIDIQNKEVVAKLKKKITQCIGFLKQRQVQVDKTYLEEKHQSQKRSLPTDDFDKTQEDFLKIGNMVSILDHQGQPIAKANVVAYPCSDMYIRDHENPDEWVSVMIHTKRRNSTLDFLPSNNAYQKWEEIGRNSFVSWPLDLVRSITAYDEFTERLQKERRKIKKNLPAGPRRRLAFVLPPNSLVQNIPADQGHDSNEPGDQGHDSNEPGDQGHDSNEPEDQGHDSNEPGDQGHDSNEPGDQGHVSSEPGDQGHVSSEPGDQGHDSNEPGDQGHDSNEPEDKGHDSNEPGHQGHDSNEPGDQGHDSNEPGDQGHDSNEPGDQGHVSSEPGDQGHDSIEPEGTADLQNRLKLHDFVEVEYPLQGKKKKTKIFYGQIVDLEELSVRFLRAVAARTFVWPQIEDISNVEPTEIMKILPTPSMDSRERLVFP